MTTGTEGSSTLVLFEHVHAYATQVRRYLEDLPVDQVDELVGGLEADLAEAVVDAPGPLPRLSAPDGATTVIDLAALFGPPRQYADELRTAAGLPPAPDEAPSARRPLRSRIARRAGATWDRWQTRLAPAVTSRQWSVARDFLRSLRPVWWVARGWVVAQAVLYVVAGGNLDMARESLAGWIVVIAVVVVSVQWGRGLWRGKARTRRLVLLVNAAAVVAVVPLLALGAGSGSSAYADGWNNGYVSALSDSQPVVSYPDGANTDGVWVDGQQVSNLFVYDANGDPIDAAQIFDDRGRPVRTVAGEGLYTAWSVPDVRGEWFFRPTLATDGRERWNAYPLRAVGVDEVTYDDDDGLPRPSSDADVRDMPLPFLKAPTAIEIPAAETPAEGSGPAGAPDAAPSGAPAPSETATSGG